MPTPSDGQFAASIYRPQAGDARYEVSFFVGPDTEERVLALVEAIMDLPEFKAVGGGAVGMERLVCACGTPTVVCECGDDRCPKCDPVGCPGGE